MTDANNKHRIEMQQVGERLDKADADYRDSMRYSREAQDWAANDLYQARMAYFQLAREPNLALKRKLDPIEFQKGDAELLGRLYRAWAEVRNHLDNLPETASTRERVDAELAEERAIIMHTAVLERYELRMVKNREDRRRAALKRKKK